MRRHGRDDAPILSKTRISVVSQCEQRSEAFHPNRVFTGTDRPGGCFADIKLDATLLKTLRETQTPGHLTLTEAAEHTTSLPISFRGLAQALDEIANENSKGTASR